MIQCQDCQISKKAIQLLKDFTSFALDHNSTFLQVFKEGKLSKHFGFCLIKLEWASANIGVCHFGFYQVTPKNICTFLTHFKKVMESPTSSSLADQSDDIQFQVIEKEIASMLIKGDSIVST